MDIYSTDENKSKHYKQDDEKRVFFKRSALNDYLPFYEKLIFFLFGFIGVQFVATILSYLVGPLINDDVLYTTLINFLSYLILIIVFVLIMFFDKRKTINRFLNDFKGWKQYIVSIVAVILIYLINISFNLIYAYSCPEIYGLNSNQSTLEEMLDYYPILSFFSIVIFAPVAEELTYRIGLVDTIGHKYTRRLLGILISALIFGFIHFDFSSLIYLNYLQGLDDVNEALDAAKNIYGIGFDSLSNVLLYAKNVVINEFLNLPIYILSGVILGFAYGYTGKISTSISAHVGNNLISYILSIV